MSYSALQKTPALFVFGRAFSALSCFCGTLSQGSAEAVVGSKLPTFDRLCVHLICFAHLLLRAGGSLFMGVFPSLPPAYYCALNIDTLSRGGAPRPPKALRCSARGRGQFAPAHRERCSPELFTLFSWRIARSIRVGRGLAPAVVYH